MCSFLWKSHCFWFCVLHIHVLMFMLNYYVFIDISICINLCIYLYIFMYLSSHLFWEKAMAPHSSTLAWRIPWTEEPGRLQSMGSLGVGTRLSDFTFTFHFHVLEKEMATHSGVLAWRIPGRGAWWAAIYGVAQSRTRLKWLSSSSSSSHLFFCLFNYLEKSWVMFTWWIPFE